MDLLAGELLPSIKSKKLRNLMRSTSNEDVIEKYKGGGFRIVTEQARFPLSSIVDLVSNPRYRLDPSFQRRHRWSDEKKSKLIESLIINVPIPPIFLYENEIGKYEVLDGLQRLSAIADFYKDRFKLKELVEWPELNGMNYSAMPEIIRLGIDRRYLSAIILLYETASDPEEASRLKKLVFERINSGGVQLSFQETRNALFPGRFNDMCIKLSAGNRFRVLMNLPTDDIELRSDEVYRSMEDVEYVLRFFANRQRSRFPSMNQREYLDIFLQAANEFNSETMKHLETLFNATVHLLYRVLGETSFWSVKRRGNDWIYWPHPMKILFDHLMAAFSERISHESKLVERKDAIRERLYSLYMENFETFEGRNNSKGIDEARRKLISEAIDDVLAS